MKLNTSGSDTKPITSIHVNFDTSTEFHNVETKSGAFVVLTDTTRELNVLLIPADKAACDELVAALLSIEYPDE